MKKVFIAVLFTALSATAYAKGKPVLLLKKAEVKKIVRVIEDDHLLLLPKLLWGMDCMNGYHA